jgi:hypothetical protein
MTEGPSKKPLLIEPDGAPSGFFIRMDYRYLYEDSHG